MALSVVYRAATMAAPEQEARVEPSKAKIGPMNLSHCH
jgi:hypothetical protein